MKNQDYFYYAVEIRKGGCAISDESLSEIASAKSAGSANDLIITYCDGLHRIYFIEDARFVKTYAQKWLKDIGISHLYEVVIVKYMFRRDVR